ncbi:unnamed protein product [Closterium sp. Naga37s-1]|nr:unnamed protein product [Closterium sp. Naga37s-1]
MALSKGLGNKPTKQHARGRTADVEEREEGHLESNAEADDAAPAVAEASPSRVPATTSLGDGGAIREALDDLDCEEDGEAEDAVSPSATAPFDPDLNADDIADYHTKVKAWIVSYIRATPTPDLPEWSDEYQGWVFGPTRTVVISGSGLKEVTPVGADPDAAEKKRVERLLRFARVKQESKPPGQQQKSKGKEPVEYEEEVEEALDSDDEY